MHVFLTCFFSQNNSTTAHIRICLNERGLDKGRMQVTPFLFLLLREAGADRQREMPGWTPKGTRRCVDPSQDRSLGEVMAPWKAAAKLLAASLEASLGLCHPSVPQQMARLKALCGLRFVPRVQCCVSVHRTVLFPCGGLKNFHWL